MNSAKLLLKVDIEKKEESKNESKPSRFNKPTKKKLSNVKEFKFEDEIDEEETEKLKCLRTSTELNVNCESPKKRILSHMEMKRKTSSNASDLIISICN
jgi:hypothetical protein